MLISADRAPHIQLEEGEPIAVERCEVRREVDRSLLVGVFRDGAPFLFTPGQLVTLWADGSVVFQGRAVDTLSVLDLISTETDDELADGEPI